MGILNMTPDSFSDGGKFNSDKSALLHAEKMMEEGASIIDIGPQSTRPKAEYLSAKDEIRRLGKIISAVRSEFPDMLISLDTFHAETVKFGFDEGIDIVNDISAGQFDGKMVETVINTGLPYIFMHVSPDYASMHEKTKHGDITCDVNCFLLDKADELLKKGMKDIILDPGFGFGKTIADQYHLLNETQFIGLGKFPLLIGISRKSFIYKHLGKGPNDVTEETQQLYRKVLEKGASILRVHEVAATKVTVDQFLNI